MLDRLVSAGPGRWCPGHGEIGGVAVLTDVRDYLRELRDETWHRLESGVGVDSVVAEVRSVLVERHPEWAGREWIEPGVGCLCAEHEAQAAARR